MNFGHPDDLADLQVLDFATAVDLDFGDPHLLAEVLPLLRLLELVRQLHYLTVQLPFVILRSLEHLSLMLLLHQPHRLIHQVHFRFI